MCLMVHIACDKKLPTIDWNSEAPDFFITELKEPDYAYSEVRSILDKKYLYYVGAHTGCGCGFSYGMYEPFDEDDVQEDINGKKSVGILFQYIKENLQHGEFIDLFTCWAGNEGKKPENTYVININQMELGESFGFKDNNQLLIIKN